MRPTIKTLGLILATTLGLTLTTTPTHAQQPWQPPTTISETGEDASQVNLATGADGTSVAVWTGHDGENFRIRAKVRRRGEPFGPTRTISPSGFDSTRPQIAVGPTGAALVVWIRRNGSRNLVEFANGTAQTGFSTPETLSDPTQTAKDPTLAVGPEGTFNVAWSLRKAGNDIVQVRVRQVGGSFGPTRDLTGAGGNAERPQIAVAPDGTTTVVWQRSSGPSLVAQSSTRYPHGTFGPAVNLSAPGGSASDPQVTSGPDGETTVAWTRSDSGQSVIQSRTRPAGDEFGEIEELSDTGIVTNLRILAGEDGTTAAAWAEFNGVRNVIKVRTRPVDGAFGPVDELALGTGDASRPQLALFPDGRLEVIWLQMGTTTGLAGSTRQPEGTFSAPALVSNSGLEILDARIIASPGGESTVVWTSDDHTVRYRILNSEGEPGPASALSGTVRDAERPRVASGPDGTAYAVWLEDDNSGKIVRFASRSRNGTFTEPITMSDVGTGTSNASVAVGSDGTVAVVWQAKAGPNLWIQARAIAPDGSIGAVTDLTDQDGSAESPQVVVDGAGTITAVWIGSDGSDRFVESSTRPSDGEFSDPETLSLLGQDASQPQVSTGPDGTTAVIWKRFDGSNQIIQTRSRPPGSSFGPIVNLSQPGQDADRPDIVTGLDGTRTAVWLRSDGTHDLVQTRRALPGAGFTAVETLSPAGHDAETALLAVGEDGTVAVIWTVRDGDESTVTLRTRPPAGTFGPSSELVSGAALLTDPALAVNPQGEVSAIWSRQLGSFLRIQAVTWRPGSEPVTVETLSLADRNAGSPAIASSPDGAFHAVWQSTGNTQSIRAASTLRSTFQLSVGVDGNGEGSVYSEPFGVICPGLCDREFASLSTITLHADPQVGSLLSGWTGACAGSGSTCEVTMDRARSTVAIFEKSTFVNVQKIGSGEGSVTSAPEGIDCGPICAQNLISNGTTVLTAGSAPGSAFLRWGGACLGDAPTCVLAGVGPHYVVAEFAKAKTLTVTKDGEGSGRVVSAPGGIDCGTTCEAIYAESRTVTLTAEPEQGSQFEGWTGPCSASAPTCEIHMSEARRVTATFSKTIEPNVCPPRTIKAEKRKLNRKKGTTTLAVRTGGAGTVLVSASKHLRQSAVRVNETGKGRITLRLKGKAAKSLKQKRRASVKGRISYRPGAGCPSVTKPIRIEFALKR